MFKEGLPKYPANRKDQRKRSLRGVSEEKVFKKPLIEKRESGAGLESETRRFFLKAAFTIISSAAASYCGFSALRSAIEKKQREERSFFDKKENLSGAKAFDEKEEKEKEKEKERESKGDVPESVEKELIDQQEDALSLEKIIHFNSGEKIVLDLEAMEKLKNYWVALYEGKLSPSLELAWQRMGFWEKESKKAFFQIGREYCRKKNLKDEEERAFFEEFEPLFYLSIPESHWDVWAVSAWAKGPFQFTAKTGAKYGLRRRENYDERTDPEKSSAAAARCLLDMYEVMNKDWNLVLSGYNGSFIWKYEKEKRGLKEGLSYENYLFFLAEEIEKIKKTALSDKFLRHRIALKEDWSTVAKKYACDEDELRKINKKNFPKGLIAGRYLVLPNKEIVRRRYFYLQVAGFSENINYPAKFLAIKEILKKRAAQKNLPEKEASPDVVIKETIKQPEGYQKIKAGSHETISVLASQFNVSVEELRKINKLKTDKIVDGKVLLVPKKKISLYSLAGNNKKMALLLHKLNPAIQNIFQPLPNGIEVKRPVWNDYLVAKKN